MNSILRHAAMAAIVSCVAAPALAAPLVQTGHYTLAAALSASNSNFNPQGLGFDVSANELLFIQQSTSSIIRTNLTGGIVGTRTLGGYNHTTSIAADANFYYFSDYTSNTSGYDLYRIGKATGSATPVGTEIAAYGGTPIDVRNGMLYRTEASTTYSYGNIDQIRISAIGTPDTILSTITLAQGGIGDFTIDTSSQSIFTLDYLSSAKIRRFSLLDGSLLETYAPTVDGLTAGLTFNNGVLYYYDHNTTTGSTLTTFAVNVGSGVPEPTTWAMMLAGFGALGFAMRRKPKVAARVRFA